MLQLKKCENCNSQFNPETARKCPACNPYMGREEITRFRQKKQLEEASQELLKNVHYYRKRKQ